ncbi:helix-turn-helix domain-containing protein [Bifidobacterium miconis]|uniref:helix-turn-helix domain-containing protein n=1 Tax=Bifidobacterium miconis TaxID=2834435 RepID=UPI001F3DDF07|nr:helix-turn-helix transcriptional regulator [Bifidobacterium miconis]
MEHIEPTSAQLGAALKDILSEIGMTQDDLGTYCGIPRNSLNRKINGGVFSFDELTRIAHVVKMPLSKIIEKAESSIKSSASALADGGVK